MDNLFQTKTLNYMAQISIGWKHLHQYYTHTFFDKASVSPSASSWVRVKVNQTAIIFKDSHYFVLCCLPFQRSNFLLNTHSITQHFISILHNKHTSLLHFTTKLFYNEFFILNYNDFIGKVLVKKLKENNWQSHKRFYSTTYSMIT